jgi:pimeloyl-ACP methyl ester carboxylesterase
MHVLRTAIGLSILAAALRAGAAEPRDGSFQTSDGIKIHYLEAGSPNAPGLPVILVHGYTGHARGNWFANGVADALAARHRVVAIDCRGHGQSDKPHDPSKYGPRMGRDVIELMDHLKIQQAHLHGYSMGGMIALQLVTSDPQRFVTVAFGGSGVAEEDEAWKAKLPPDKPGPDPREAEARQKLTANPDRDEKALAAVRGYSWSAAERPRVDLTKLKIPVLAINGEFDRPIAKTQRMKRELSNFKSVVLPGKSHLTAIMAGYMPKEYVDALVTFIDAHDPSTTR